MARRIRLLCQDDFSGYSSTFAQLDDCDSASGWSDAYPGSSDITSGPSAESACVEGGACVRIDVSYTHGFAGIEKDVTWDLSAWSYLSLWTYIHDDDGFSRVVLYLFSGSAYAWYYPTKYEGSYESDSDVYYAGWNYKLFDLTSPTGTSGDFDLASVTRIRIRWNYTSLPTEANFRVDDISVRAGAHALYSSTGGLWAPPNDNMVFGIHEPLAEGSTTFLRIWNTLRTGSGGHGRALRAVDVPRRAVLTARVRFGKANGWVRLQADAKAPDSGSFEGHGVFLSDQYDRFGIESIQAALPGGRLYRQVSVGLAPDTWYTLLVSYDGFAVSALLDNSTEVAAYVAFRQPGSVALESYLGSFASSPDVGWVDVTDVNLYADRLPEENLDLTELGFMLHL